jgi:hypothetical protein
MPRYYLQIPTEVELGQLELGLHNAHRVLPPPGMTKGYDAGRLAELDAGGVLSLGTLLYVEGTPPQGTEQDWYWGNLGDFVVSLPDAAQSAVSRILSVVSEVAAEALGDALLIPLVKKGTANINMKWLRTTYRGTLGPDEQFQHKLDWGHPGADPSTSEAEALTIAQTISASFLADFWGGPTNESTVHAAFPPDVVYTEVGVVLLELNSNGGKPTETYGTQWFMYPAAGRPAGTGGNSLPYEVSCCVSTQTDHRGQSGRGRFYLPPFHTQQVLGGGKYTSAQVGSIAAAFGHHIETVKTGTGLVPVVVSQTHQILNEITSLNVGVIPDSQRRRRRSLDEARVIAWHAA